VDRRRLRFYRQSHTTHETTPTHTNTHIHTNKNIHNTNTNDTTEDRILQ